MLGGGVSTVWVVMMVVVAQAGCGAAQERPVVTVAQGEVMGVEVTEYNITHLQFLSIPYAQPPVGPLRFKDPEPAGPWEGTLDASQHPPPCDQFLALGSEDCLFLSVYTPQDALIIDFPLPVMVYIHGGGYYLGSSRKTNGFEALVERGVIVVMLQYRLGVLGFLSTEDAAAPGNQGLKDQTLAIKWVRDNIAAFGGDFTKITLFGGSAGAASIHYQMLAPSAEGLFTAAILQSGNTLCPWGRGRDFLQTAQAVGERFGCPTLPTDALVSCLQTQDEHELDQSYVMFIEWNFQPFYFAPYVNSSDGYLPGEPAVLLQEGRYHHVPAIVGINRDELGMETVEMYATPALIESLTVNFTVNGPVSLELYPDEEPVTTATTVYTTYLQPPNITTESCDNLTRMYTDGLFLVRHDWTLQLMSGRSPVFAYELHHRGEHGFTDTFLDQGLDLPQARDYICHGDNSQYILFPEYGDLQTTADVTVGNLFVTMWTNFAKTQNPTPDGFLGFVWEPSNPQDLLHLKILPQPFMEVDQRSQVRLFWEGLPLRVNAFLNP